MTETAMPDFSSVGPLGHVPAAEPAGTDSGRAESSRLKNIEQAAVELGRRIDGVQILGLHLTDFFSGMAIGWTSRNLAKGALIAATGGVGYGGAMIAGGVAGAITGAAREYIKQVRENINEAPTTPGLEERRLSLKEKLRVRNKGSLAIAAGKGVVMGTLGGLAGSYVLEHAGEWLDRLGGGNQPSGSVTEVSSQASTGTPAKPANLEAVQKLFETPENPAAAAVGAHLELTNKITDQVLSEAKIDPHSLSSEAYERVRLGVQHKMEGLANANFENVAFNAPPSESMDNILQQARGQLDNSWNDNNVIQLLKDGAKQELANQQTAIPGTNIENLLHQDIQIKPGGSFWQSFNIPQEYFPSGSSWVNSANGVTQSDVIKDMIAKFAEANGHNLNQIPPGTLSLNSLGLTPEQMEIIKAVSKTTSVDDYRMRVMPSFQALLNKVPLNK